MKPATLKNLDIFEGRQGNIEERQYSSKYAIMESAAAFVAAFHFGGLAHAEPHRPNKAHEVRMLCASG
jgi:hypothetical protein